MNIVPEDVLKQKRLQKTIGNAPADPVVNLILARVGGAKDNGPWLDWESMTDNEREAHMAGFWRGVAFHREQYGKEQAQWREILSAYLWWWGDLE